jgi:hypothetical protein
MRTIYKDLTVNKKVILDLPKTIHPKTQLAILFKAWQAGAVDKWDVYPRAREFMDKRKVTLKDVIELGAKFCNIPEGVIKERMRYMKQLNDQKIGE